MFLRSVLRLLVTANVVPSSPILVTLMMEETSVLTGATRLHIPEDDSLYCPYVCEDCYWLILDDRIIVVLGIDLV
jgi:hypothetical protein